MTIPILLLVLALHLISSLVQLVTNALTDSSCTASLACGNGAIERLITTHPEADLGAVSLIWGLIQTMGNVVFALLIFDYDWLSGGPEVVQMAVNIVRGVLICVYIVVLIRIGGDMARSLRLPFT